MSVAQVWAKGGVWSAIQKWGRVFTRGLRSRSDSTAPGTPRTRVPPATAACAHASASDSQMQQDTSSLRSSGSGLRLIFMVKVISWAVQRGGSG